MRNNLNTLFIVQKSAHMLSVLLYPTSSFTNSVVTTEMPRVLSSSSSLTLQPRFTNRTGHLPRRLRPSVAYSLPWLYPPETLRATVPISGSARIPGTGAYPLLVNAPR